MIKPAYFDKCTWWVHVEKQVLFVVVDVFPAFDDDGLEIGILAKGSNRVDYRKEADLEALRIKKQIKSL